MLALLITVPAEDEDAATTALWEAGTTGIEVCSAPGSVALLAYFHQAPPDEALLSLPSGARVRPTEVPEADWVARFREGFRSFRVGSFHVSPPWEAREPGRHVLLVDPGRAFGTGTHETTRLCLLALEELARRGPLGRCLDLGSGTGLLAVAAARLGASRVLASDLDPEATSASVAHACLNGVALTVVRADGARGLRSSAFDLVLANLTAPLLVERAPEIASLVAPAGSLVLSGFLLEDEPAVASAYAALGPHEARADGEWAALVLREARR
jgi:ribosomal protein L11 methyltransferase